MRDLFEDSSRRLQEGPIVITVSVKNELTPYADSNYQYATTMNTTGKIDWENGGGLRYQCSEIGGPNLIDLNLRIKSKDNKVFISGNSKSRIEYSIYFKGFTFEKTPLRSNVASGEQSIKLEAMLEKTYGVFDD